MILASAGLLDTVRSRILRVTLRLPGMARVFSTRSYRLAVLFVVVCSTAIVLSSFFPLWVLLIGPFVYGVPHIISSVRYFHYSVSEGPKDKGVRGRVFGFLSILLIFVFAYRMIVNVNVFALKNAPLSEWKGSTFLELGVLGIAFLGCAVLYRKSLARVLCGTFLLLPLVGAFVWSPLWTIGALVLLHNFVAFVYWIIAAKTPGERRVAAAAFAITLAVTAAIFAGSLDFLYQWAGPARALEFARLSVADTGRMIAPWSSHELFWLRASVAFAFGQSLHYFVWLKAIPDQFHTSDAPTSFRQSWNLLELDFGKKFLLVLFAIVLGTWMLWGLLNLQLARLVYFSLAAFHGYIEIAGLGLASGRNLMRFRMSRPFLL